jgi:hypothetical protein
MPVSFIGASNFKGYWDASTNSGSADFLNTGEPLLASSASSGPSIGGYNVAVTPALTASVGDYWQVTNAGSTNIDGETNWQLNDWCLYVSSSTEGFRWQRLSVSDTAAAVVVGQASSEELKTDLLASASAQSGPNNAYGENGEILFASSSDAAGNKKYFEGSNTLTWNSNASILNLTGTLKVSGTIEATTLHTVEVTSSILYDDGSTRFGDSADDSHEFSGSVYVLTGLTSSAGISGSYFMGDGSRLTGISAGSALGNPVYVNAASSSVPFWGAIDSESKYGLTGSGRFNFYSASSDLQVTGTIRATDFYVGTSIIHEGDVDNFITFGTDQLSAEINGFETFRFTDTLLRFNPNGDDTLDFVVSGSKTMIFVDAGTDRVGIAHNSPQTDFDVSGSTILGRDDGVTVSTHQVSGAVELGDTVRVGQDIIHWDDADTKITFTDDQIDFTAGGVTLLTLDETTQDAVIIGDGTDVDFQVKTLNDNHTIFVVGSTDRVGIGYSAPPQKLSVSGSTIFGRPSGEGDSHWFSGSIYVSDDIHVEDKIYGLNDTDTYIDLNTDDQITLTAGGVNMIQLVEASEDYVRLGSDSGSQFVDVRMGGAGNDDTLWVDGASNNVGIRCSPSGTTQALTVSGSTLFGTDSTDDHHFSGSMYVSDDIAFGGNLHNASDDDTYISFTDDRMSFYAGNIQFADYNESPTGQDITTFNGSGQDIDFLIKSNGAGGAGAGTNLTHTIFVEASSARVGIAESSPSAQLDVSGSVRFGREIATYHAMTGTLELTGNIGLNTPATDYSLTLPNINSLQGRGMAYAWSTYSSARYKQNVETMPNPIETAKKLRGVEFTWKETGYKDFGFIAEEVGKVLPQLVSYEEDGKHAIGMDYSKITSLLVECVKYQQSQIETQEDRIKELEKKLSS